MNRFNYNHRLRKRIIFTLTTTILIGTMLVSQKNSQIMTFSENALGSITSPLSKALYYTGSKAKEGFESIFGSRKMREEYDILVQENKRLEEQVGIMEDVISREPALKAEFSLLESTKTQYLRGMVVAKDPSNYTIGYNIDKGKQDGVGTSDIVVQGIKQPGGTGDDIIEGLIGRVESVGLNFSKITTIMTEGAHVSFQVQRTGDTGVLTGTPDQGLTGYLYDQEADIHEGDKLYTSGLGGVYPRGIYIGEISATSLSSDGLTKEIKATSPIDFSNIFRVLILPRKEMTDE